MSLGKIILTTIIFNVTPKGGKCLTSHVKVTPRTPTHPNLSGHALKIIIIWEHMYDALIVFFSSYTIWLMNQNKTIQEWSLMNTLWIRNNYSSDKGISIVLRCMSFTSCNSEFSLLITVSNFLNGKHRNHITWHLVVGMTCGEEAIAPHVWLLPYRLDIQLEHWYIIAVFLTFSCNTVKWSRWSTSFQILLSHVHDQVHQPLMDHECIFQPLQPHNQHQNTLRVSRWPWL